MMRRGRALIGLSLLVLLVQLPGRAADPIKLNGPLVSGGRVDDEGLAFSPDSSRVLYRADQDTDNVFEIYSVPSTGGTPTKLNGPLVAGGVAGLMQFSPDSNLVLYRADQDTNNVPEIYSVPSTGGTPVKLNGPLVSGGGVDYAGLAFSPDSSRVLYLVDQDNNNLNEIYSVPSTGGVAVKLNAPLVVGGGVGGAPKFSPDSSRVLYIADQETDGVFEIFSVPSTGGAAVKLNEPLVAGGDVFNMQFSPDSSRVLYRADQDTSNMVEIYSVPSAGGTPVKLNGPLVEGGFAGVPKFSPDGSRVLYVAEQDTDNIVEIYSVPSTGGTATKLNSPLVAGGNVGYSQFSPDGNRVLYLADQDTDNVSEIYSVPSTGGTPVKLNGPLVAGGDVFEDGLAFSPDSSRVLYLADQDIDFVNEIYIVPATGGTPVKLNGPLVAGGDVLSMQYSPDGSNVLYRADQDTDGVFEIYVRIIRDKANVGGGDWDAGGTWDQGVAPDEVMQVFIDTFSTVTASGSATVRTVNELAVGGGAGASMLSLQDGAVISAINGVSIHAGGIVRGDGRIDGDVEVFSGELLASQGDTLTISSVTAPHEGRILLEGGTVKTDSQMTNAALGEILGRGALITGGLTNHGDVAFSSGVSAVFGSVDNHSTGRVIVSGNAEVTFWGDVTHSGALFHVSEGSSATFFADAGFSIAGGGDVYAEDDFTPGSSPGLESFGGSVHFGAAADLQIELAGTDKGDQYDALDIDEVATLDGQLSVTLPNVFTPALGDTFEILTAAGGVSGTFAEESLPDLGPLKLDVVYGTNSVVLAGVGLMPGDYNADGFVNLLDYVVWRDARGLTGMGLIADASGPTEGVPDFVVDQFDYDYWAANFGNTLGSGAGLDETTAAVPEPASLVLFAMALISVGLCRRRRLAAGGWCLVKPQS